MAKTAPQFETEILTRVIMPRDGNLTVETANSFLSLRFPDRDIDRMNELAEKSRLGQVSFKEQEELESYSRVGSLLNLIQSKARRSIQAETS